METRRFGRTEHQSTVAILGAFAFSRVDQATADAAMEQVMAHGVNHIDVAPSYGAAEDRLAPWLARHPDHFFLGDKTGERGRAGAAAELRGSLKRLGIDHFDLFQLHAITTFAELDAVTGPGGALEAIVEARAAGLTRFIGITGHGLLTPAVFREALRRFDFDSVLFPINFIQLTHGDYRREAEALLAECRARDVGVMIMKSIARGPWGGHLVGPWTVGYQPWTEPAEIRRAVDFVLSHPVTGLATVGDTRLLPLVLDACAHFAPMDTAQREALIAYAAEHMPLQLPEGA
jgi:aryl-alcohol dehydrogenase-like predicted oxidoreductase